MEAKILSQDPMPIKKGGDIGKRIHPRGITSPPAEVMPEISAPSSMSEDMRVSMPMVMRGGAPFSSVNTSIASRGI